MIKLFPNGITIAELKELLRDYPDKDPDTGDDNECWFATGESCSSPVTAVANLNRGDILFTRVKT